MLFAVCSCCTVITVTINGIWSPLNKRKEPNKKLELSIRVNCYIFAGRSNTRSHNNFRKEAYDYHHHYYYHIGIGVHITSLDGILKEKKKKRASITRFSPINNEHSRTQRRHSTKHHLIRGYRMFADLVKVLVIYMFVWELIVMKLNRITNHLARNRTELNSRQHSLRVWF